MTAFRMYRDKFKCPSGHKRVVMRRTTSAGKAVTTYCIWCCRRFKAKAGAVK